MCSHPPFATSPAPCVLVINTGGTFGMKSKNGGPLSSATKEDLEDHLRSSNIFGTYCVRNKTFTIKGVDKGNGRNQDRTVSYKLMSLKKLLDSSNMKPSGWNQIAKIVKQNYREYIGFVVIHGTDTMVYTASVLSFMFENLGKPVVITGAQKPIFEARSDGRDNLINSVIVAGTQKIPEVLLCFGNKVFRGNRCVKVDSSGFNAFDSPNHPPLIELGVQMKVNRAAVGMIPRRQQHWSESLRVVEILTERMCDCRQNCNCEGVCPVGILRVYPGITMDKVSKSLDGMLAVVLQSFGAGNTPDNDEFKDALTDFTTDDSIIINVTQCLRGTVTSDYACGKWLEECGVIPGGDITEEAAFCKLCYMISRRDSNSTKWLEDLKRPIRKEMTPLPRH